MDIVPRIASVNTHARSAPAAAMFVFATAKEANSKKLRVLIGT